MNDLKDKSFICLVVEDDVVQQLWIMTLMKDLGFRNILVADDGEDAWDIIQQERVDIILSDYFMPRVDGLELLSRVRRSDIYWSIPFIMITSESRKSKVIYSTEEEIDAYIVKPITSEKLNLYVSRTLRNRYSPDKFYQTINAGKIKLRLGRKEAAFESFRKASEINSTKSAPYYYMGEIMEEFNKNSEAIENYQKCNDASNSLFVKAFDGLSRIYIKEKDYDSAAEILKKAVKVSPANIDRSINLGKCCYQAGDVEGAKESLLNASRMAGNDTDSVEKIARICFDLDLVEDAEAILRKIYDPNVREFKVFNQFGLMSKEKGEFEKAKTYYFEALKISPHSDIVNYNCAVLSIKMKDYNAAKDHLKRSLLHHSEFRPSKELLEKLEKFIAGDGKDLTKLIEPDNGK